MGFQAGICPNWNKMEPNRVHLLRMLNNLGKVLDLVMK